MFNKCVVAAFLIVSCHPSHGDAFTSNIQEAGVNPENSEEEWVPTKWLDNDVSLGQVGGITVDRNDTIYIFHRADRKWTDTSFTYDNVYADQDKGPITEPTIIVLDKNGRVLQKLGEGLFYMPHGITVDHDFNLWVTDVALHQVMKFEPSSTNALLVQGTRFIPGRDSTHFCKPTSIAVLLNGDFFIADGYCNSRIVKFNASGKKILEWGRSTVHPGFRIPGPGEFYIPHALTLTREESLLCVADRENGRIQCFHPTNGTFSHIGSTIPNLAMRVFSVAYSSYKGGSFVLVTGPNTPDFRGFIVSEKNGELLHKFGSQLTAPHDVAVSTDGSTIYVGKSPLQELKLGNSSKIFDCSMVNTEPTSTPGQSSVPPGNGDSVKVEIPPATSEERGLLDGAILISTACLIFSVVLLVAASVYRRSKNNSAKDSASLLPHSDY